jgi:hypothetical protein
MQCNGSACAQPLECFQSNQKLPLKPYFAAVYHHDIQKYFAKVITYVCTWFNKQIIGSIHRVFLFLLARLADDPARR